MDSYHQGWWPMAAIWKAEARLGYIGEMFLKERLKK